MTERTPGGPRMYQIDAFTSRRFGGNPAAVVALEEWPSDTAMQRLAEENRLAETAFVVPSDLPDCDYKVRWFTPTVEVDLCGHATVASAHALSKHFGESRSRIVFDSRSGPLPVAIDRSTYTLDFPSSAPEPVEGDLGLIAALGAEPKEIRNAWAALAVFETADQVRALKPDMSRLIDTGLFGVIATAPGDAGNGGPDFVSRFFAPAAGVPEDPATGSAHCILTPYWAPRLGKDEMLAHQISERLGEIRVKHAGERTLLTGSAVTVFEAQLCEPI